MPSDTTGSARVVTLTADDVVQRVRTAVATLSGNGGSLAEATKDGLNYDLDDEPYTAFGDLKRVAFLAGLPSLPCCATHDQDVIDAWVNGVTRIAVTGQLPG